MDSEGLTREFVRSLSIVPSAQVVFGIPEADSPTLPLIALQRIGGETEWDWDRPMMLFSVWGSTKHEASTTSQQLTRALAALGFRTSFKHVGSDASIDGVVGMNTVSFKDVSSKCWRYDTSCVLYVRNGDV